jgi:hypothetical protein
MRAAAMMSWAAPKRCCLVGALLLTSAVPARGISVRSSSWHTPVVGYLLVSGGFVPAAAARDAAPSAMARGPSVATGVAPQERRQLTGSVMTDSNITTQLPYEYSPTTDATYCRLQSASVCWGNTHRFLVVTANGPFDGIDILTAEGLGNLDDDGTLQSAPAIIDLDNDGTLRPCSSTN